MAADGISIRAYAEHRRRSGLPGGTKNAVEKALAAGRITRTRGGKIDPKTADEEWAATTTGSPGSAAQPLRGRNSGAGRRSGASGGEDTQEPSNAQRFSAARAMREEERAKLAALEYATAAGEVILAKPMRQEAHRLGRLVRDRILTVPDRVAAICAAETDPGAVRRLLVKELKAALTAISDE